MPEVLRFQFCCLLLIALHSGLAHGEDPLEALRQEDVATCVGRLGAARLQAQKDQVRPLLDEAVALHNLLASDTHRRRLQAAVGALLGDESMGGARLDAADALGRFKDPDGAYRQLRPHLPGVRDEAASPLAIRVLDAVGALAPDAAAAVLTDLMQKAADVNVARHAIQALGGYGWSRRRLKVLDSLLETLRRLRPAGPDARSGRGSGAGSRERYNALQPALVEAMNRLTGQQLAGPDQWFALAEAHKKDLEPIFRNRLP